MRIIPPRFHMTRHDHADFRRVWRSVAEAALTLFIIVIFCLSAAQVVSLVHQETKNIESEYLHDETSRSNRMLIRRSAEDFQTTVMAYYLGNTDLPLTEMERQRSYFLNMIERILELETAENDDLRRYHSQLLQAVKNIVAYEGRTLPLSYADISSLVSDVEKFKNDVSNVLESLSRRDTGRQDSVSALDQKHSFLMSSIVSMTVSGLGLIVLLLMKLRASDKLLQERRNLSSLLEPRMAAIETAMDGVAITDAQGRLRYVNQALTDYHGYAAPEMLTHLPWKTLYDEEQQKWFDEEVMPYLLHEGRWRGHCKGLRLDGTYFHQDVAIAALDDGGYVFVVRDYTDLLDSIMLSNRRLAAIEAAGDGIGIVDNKGRLTYINKALRELHGFSEVELSDYIGQDWSLIYTPKGQDDIKAHVIPALRQTGQWHGEAPILRKNGTVVSTELSLTMLPDGGFIGTARDISERKKAELEKEELQRQFYQAQKMEAIGRMAGGIAHDFNNILSSILGYAEFLIDDLDKETQQHGFARQIYNGGTQARKLVDQILAFSRRREGGMDVLSLADAVRDTVDMLRPVMPPSVRLQVDNDGGDNIVHANSTQISQALMNLCVNAIDAAEDSVDAAVSVTSETMVADDGNVPLVMLADHLPKADQEPLVTIISDKDGSTLLMSGSLQRGASYACVSVSDNGCGMDRTVMEHIFEPFFTTKPVDRGTGLGLAAVHGIVAGHRGGMTVRSKPGEGTTFTLYLPQTSEEKAQKQGFSTKVVMGGGQILVVDDQPDVAAIAAEMLTRLGYNVDMAAAGDAAIDLLRERPGHYDLVLSDYSMPEMTGVELAEHIHADFPGLPVVIMTGYGRKKLDKEMKDHPAIVTMIRKPLDRVVLSQVISRALKRSEAA